MSAGIFYKIILFVWCIPFFFSIDLLLHGETMYQSINMHKDFFIEIIRLSEPLVMKSLAPLSAVFPK